MDILDPDFLNMRPICGGQEPEGEEAPPERIVTHSFADVWSEDSSDYTNWLLSSYKPLCHYAPINFATAGVHLIKQGLPTSILLINNIFFTVDDETNITLYINGVPVSGPMDFGGDGEPRGIVIPFPYSPLTAGFGAAFQIGSSAAVQVSGMLSYMLV